MQQPEFDITIGKDGKLKIHVKGAQGAKCLELADLVRDIVGKEESRQLTSEYYDPGPNVRMNVDVRNRNA
ncbi:MAG: DUF2997 domain-containing protein [Phycisphaerae bacterium]|jgi:hypothetical protein